MLEKKHKRTPRPRLGAAEGGARGLVPAVVLVVAAALGKRRLALLALAVGVPLYLSWAVLLMRPFTAATT